MFYHCFQTLRTSCVGTHGKEQGDGGICPGSLVFLRMLLPELPSPSRLLLSVKVEISLSWGVGREEESGGRREGPQGVMRGETLWRGSFPFLYDIAKNQDCPVRGCIKTSQKSEEGSKYSSLHHTGKQNQKQKNFPGEFPSFTQLHAVTCKITKFIRLSLKSYIQILLLHPEGYSFFFLKASSLVCFICLFWVTFVLSFLLFIILHRLPHSLLIVHLSSLSWVTSR